MSDGYAARFQNLNKYCKSCTYDCSTVGYLAACHTGLCSVFVFDYVVLHFVWLICDIYSLEVFVPRCLIVVTPCSLLARL
jgi:hypothetical protein